MRQRLLLPMTLLALLAALLPTPAGAAPRCFPEAAPAITNCIDGRIREFWERQGGLPVFGYPLTPAATQPTDRGMVTVQLFERARIEHHPNNRAPYDILLGRLGADALAASAAPAPAREQQRSGCVYFAATGYNLCEPFLSAWRRYGLDLGEPGVSAAESLALFGLPIGPATAATLPDGATRTIQWFERARFEDHGPDGVLFGLLGRELLQHDPSASAIAPNLQPPASSLPRGGFIQASGTQLTRLGQPIQIKGVNYYPQRRPWGEMWSVWNGEQALVELRLARDQLGINAVRILLPYDIKEVSEGNVTSSLLTRLREIVQIAGDLDMRVIVTLFDFYNEFPAPGTAEEERNLNYLRLLIGNFAGDDRIMAWDIHNEPDHYQTWEDGRPQQVLSWLGRMADEIHRLTPNHLVTVGMGQYQNLLVAGPDGRRPIDYSDVISLHNYNAGDMVRQLNELRAATNKPILLGEFGWPTGPACVVPGYDEARQAQVYREALQAATGRVAGVIVWTLRDFDSGPTRRWDTREEHYGLYRIDGTLKPAAETLRAYNAPPLPSTVDTALPLTNDGESIPGGPNAPLLIPASGHYVKGTFRRAWELLGGQGSFGLPLTEAFVRPEDGRVVQYFEAGVLELLNTWQFGDDIPVSEQRALVTAFLRPSGIGLAYALEQYPPAANQGEGGVRVAQEEYRVSGTFSAFYRGIDGKWRLGPPISEELVEEVNGVPTKVQYFHHGRLELNPQTGNPEVSRLGRWALDQRCRAVG